MIMKDSQIADVLSLLGEDVSRQILDHFDEAERARLEPYLNASPSQLQSAVERFKALQEFEAYMQFAMSSGIVQPRLHVAETGQDEDEPDPLPTVISPKSLENPLQGLQKLSPYQLGRALEHEQSRTVAILLGQLPAKVGAEVLSTFPEERRALVVRDLSKALPVPPMLVDRIARTTLQRAAVQPPVPPDRRDNFDRLAEVLREMPKPMRMKTLKEIGKDDLETSKSLSRRLYRFEDLIEIDSGRIKQMLGEVDATVLATALFQAPEAITQAIMGNLSKRARQSLQEEMQFQSQVPEARLQQAREAIVDVIARLDMEQE